MKNILKTYGLSKTYGNHNAVKDLNITIPKSSVFAILGPNGSGKSTTLGMLLQSLKPSSGHFEWFDKKPESNDLKEIGAMLEQPKFYMHLNAMDNLFIVARIKKVPYDGIEESLKKVGLFDRRFDTVKTYSMGMRQRLGIAAAIFHGPKALILDEPTNGLDPEGINDVRNLIIDLSKDGLSIILASHLLNEVEMVSSHVCILSKGICVYQGSMSELKKTNEKIFQLGSSNLENLRIALLEFNKLNKIEIHKSGNYLVVHFSKDVKLEDISNFLSGKDVFLTHFIEQQFTLEEKFIEILKK
tara:strand:- start:1207 stop:2106 length:900 start_codon:yes stop_codon:yes gene_type:complete